LITGGAGFIGSHLAERLLKEGVDVRILDNLSTGREENIAPFRKDVEFIFGDILDESVRKKAVDDVEVIFHEAAIPSVPRSVANPVENHKNGADATILLLDSARRDVVRRVVFAASAAAYGESEELPKVESMLPDPVSPYAATKVACEHYLRAFAHCYDIDTVSLRYFNVFGPRQDPSSPYSGVISKFCLSFMNGTPITIFGDGEQSRDFTYVDNVVEANWLAATASPKLNGNTFNVGCGKRITINQMMAALNDLTGKNRTALYEPSRPGDVRHSLADLSRIRESLGYTPLVSFEEGLRKTYDWYNH
jgi:UDP-glucose 4-epimerase